MQVLSRRQLVEVSWLEQDEREVVVTAIGERGDVHTKAPQPNTGRAVLAYPRGLRCSSWVRVADVDGQLVAQGLVTV